MPRKLRYSDQALADLDGVRRWLTQPGAARVAWRRLAAIRAAINRLRQHPCRYPPGEHHGVRELPCGGGYRALYLVDSRHRSR
jgi:plasmid stabilization system protein ParE